jgi:hypothetical protein
MSDEDIVIGDMEPDDAHDPDDGNVDWSNVEQVASQIDSINAIEDEDERTEAAKQWAAELGGEG